MILQMLVTATSQALTYMARERHMDASALLSLGAVHRSGRGLPHKAVFVQASTLILQFLNQIGLSKIIKIQLTLSRHSS